MRFARGLVVALGLCACLPAGAGAASAAAQGVLAAPAVVQAAPSVGMHVALQPGRLGRATAVEIDIRIATPPAPPPVSTLAILYPSELGFTSGELGLQACSQSTLEAHGPAGCPVNSRMGDGSARAEAPFASGTIGETGKLLVIRGPELDEHTQLLFYVENSRPLSAQLAFSSVLLAASAPYEQIQLAVPPIQSVTEAPPIALVSLHLTLDPPGLRYYETRHGRRVAYHPTGVILPHRCPRGGFPFGVQIGFVGGARASARAVDACAGRE